MSAQKTMNTESLRPINGIVQLHDNYLVTVPVFNIKHMIKSILTDPKLMNDQYFPNGYNVLTGEVTNEHTNDKYGRFILVMHGFHQGIGIAKIQMICQLH